MAFFFGLRVSRNLTDIVDAEESLKNLFLDTEDIEIFKGLSEDGVQRSDFKTLSGLDFDLEKIINAIKTETVKYDALTSTFFDQNSVITSNLNINGQLGAGAIKYRFVDFNDANRVKTADISTSRVSSWSAFDNPLTPTSQIFYGGDVKVGGPIELTTLNISTAATPKRFEAEVPTHRIKVKIGNEDVYLYAMKGIPLTFRGFFRTANLSININSLYPVRPSWIVKNTVGGAEFVYENRLNGNLSNIVFSDSAARERDIQLFYPVNGIITVSAPSINLIQLPPVTLPNLQNLSIQSNDFREMPNLSTYSNLINFDISQNDLTRATNDDPIFGISGTIAGVGTAVNTYWRETTVACTTTGLEAGMILSKTSGIGAFGGVCFIQAINSGILMTIRSQSANTVGAIVFSAQRSLKSLTKQIVDRIPTSVQSLNMGNCYTGTVTGTFENYTNLKSFRIESSPGRRSSGVSPRVNANAIENYDIRYNFFTNIDKSVQTGTKLKQLLITDNRISDGNITIASPDLEYFESYYSNSINVIDVSNKTKLATYIIYSNGIIDDPVNNPTGRNVTNKFDGCSALKGLTVMFAGGATGALPAFVGCSSLETIDFYATSIQNASAGFVITSSTFDACRSTLRFFRIVSGAITGNAIIAPTALRNMRSLYYFEVSSAFNGLFGALPSFASAPALQYVILYQNNLTGTIPDFSANPSFYYLDLRWNNFIGKVPDIAGTNFFYAYLADNNLTEFTPISSTRLRVLQLTRNRLTTIPFIGNLNLLNEFYFNDQKLDGGRVVYDSINNNFAGLVSLRTLDIANNRMSQGDINQIIKDLNKNYDANPRSGVGINLRGNDAPSTDTGDQVASPEDDIPAIITKLRRAGWSIQVS